MVTENVQITPGSGDVVAADQVTDATFGTAKVQFVKLIDGTIGGTNKAVVGANGLAVNVMATVLAANAATSTKQSDGSQKTQIVDGSGNVIASTSGALNVAVTTGTIAAGTAGAPSANVVTVQGVSGGYILPTSAAGDTPSGATDTGNPVKTGGVAKTALPTAVADGQRVNDLHDKIGRQLSIANLRTQTGTQVTTITNTTETTVVTAQAGFYADLYGLILANTGATATTVVVKDATGGTTRCEFYVPAGDTRGFMLPLDAGIAQTATASNWTVTCGSTTTLVVSALYVNNV